MKTILKSAVLITELWMSLHGHAHPLHEEFEYELRRPVAGITGRN